MLEAAFVILNTGPAVLFWFLMIVGFLVMVGYTIRVFLVYLWHAVRYDNATAMEEVERRFLR